MVRVMETYLFVSRKMKLIVHGQGVFVLTILRCWAYVMVIAAGGLQSLGILAPTLVSLLTEGQKCLQHCH